MAKLPNNSETSDLTQSEVESASVFDFLYVDHQRINTFLSQFSEFGGLSSIVHAKAAGRGKEDAGTFKAQGSAVVVKGEANYSEKTKAELSESSQRTYDPLWSNTLSFLDKIEDRNLLKRDIEQAAFGDLVLIMGPVSIRDFGLLEKVWSLPSFKAIAEHGNPENSGNREERRRSAKAKKGKADPPSEIDLFFELAKVLPHPTQFKIGSEPMAWGILREDGLIAPSSDFVLKFGGAIPGEWAAVCILDAVPDKIDETLADQVIPNDEVAGMIMNPLEPVVRQFLGRPVGSYGITPLAVFREVGRQ